MKIFFRFPVLLLGIIAAITVFFVCQLPRIEIDNNNIRFLPQKNDARLVSEYIDDTFGGSVMVLVGLERPYGTVFEPAFLQRIREFVTEIEPVQFVGDINSIMSTQYISASGDTIVVDSLVPDGFSGSAGEIAELRRRIASWDLFRGSIVSDDVSATQIIISLDVSTGESASPEVAASMKEIQRTAESMFEGLANVYITGMPFINATINDSMIKDNMLLVPLVVIIVLTVLFLSFRRLTFVLLPLITVIVAVIWTVGAMALFGVKLSVLTTILPVILVAVGSAYGIHVVTHYIEDARGRVQGTEEHRELIYALAGKLIKPVALAALTTFAGFISFYFTPIIPMREFGFCTSFGVLACFIAAVTLIPSLLLVRGPEKHRKDAAPVLGDKKDTLNSVIARFFLAAVQRRIPVLVITILLTALSFYGLSKVIVDNVLIEYFQNETGISRSDRFIRQHFGGSKDLTLVIEADTTEELLDPAVLCAVDNLCAWLMERVPMAGKAAGFTDIIKRMNQVFNAGESPEGLRAAEPGQESRNGDDFGFGFGDFGEDAPSSASPAAGPAEKIIEAKNKNQLTVNELFVLLDNASAKSANMNGNDLAKELKRLVNYDGFSYYEIPSIPERYGKKSREDLRRIIANYLVLLAGDAGAGYSNDPLEPTAIKTVIQLRTTGNNDTQKVIDLIKAYVEANFPKNVRVVIGGGAVQEGAVTALIVKSQIISIAVSVLAVLIIVALSYRSIAAGIIAAVPLAIAILCNFAAMGFLRIKLNIGTALIASLAVGIGIDYTIHFIETFKREYSGGGTENDTLYRSFCGCGKAILVNTLSVGAGFAVLCFSRFRILAEFGVLIALSMAITALVSLILIPVLLVMIKPQFLCRRT
ncbi:MAG: MMPL family transporter [Treponema sp.]|nr:MMPL family transporter [Treponema sp.]